MSPQTTSRGELILSCTAATITPWHPTHFPTAVRDLRPTYPAGNRYTCDKCGVEGILDVEYDYEKSPRR